MLICCLLGLQLERQIEEVLELCYAGLQNEKNVYKGKKHKIKVSYINCMLRILIGAGKKGVHQTRIG